MESDIVIGELKAQVCGLRRFSVLSLFVLSLLTWRGVSVVWRSFAVSAVHGSSWAVVHGVGCGVVGMARNGCCFALGMYRL